MMTTEEARAFFSTDTYATKTTGITIESVGPERVVCKLITDARHMTSHGGVMGGVLFTLADFCFAVAANDGKVLTVTGGSTIRYISRAKDDTLTAVCVPVHNGKRTCVYETTITDGTGNLVATVLADGVHIG